MVLSAPTSTVTSSTIPSKWEGMEWVDTLARVGYAAKGVVYAVIGGLAFQLAIGSGGDTTGPKGALAEIAEQPFGKALLAIVAVGLAGYAVWRIVQAWVDPEEKGTDAKGIATRIGYVCSGVVYAGLAVESGRILFMGGGGGDSNAAAHWTGKLMAQPWGHWLVGAVGIAIIGTGIFQLYKAWTAEFQKMLLSHEMSATELTWSERIGRAGFAARGVVYLIMGGFLIVAAISSNPGEAVGIGQALQYLREQPYGPWLLGLVAAGLFAYGLFSGLILSRYRRILGHG